MTAAQSGHARVGPAAGTTGAVPSQRAAPGLGDRSPSTSADVLRSLGLEALVELVERTAYGVCITGEDHTWTYLNPAGAALLGRPFEELRGRDYLLSFPEHEREALLALEADQRDGDDGFYTNTVVRPDGSRREMTWSGTVLTVDGVELAPAVFHDTTAVNAAQREAATKASAAAARITDGGVLDAVTGAVVTETRADAAVLLVRDDADLLRVVGSSPAQPALADAVRAHGLRLADFPGADDLRAGRTVPAVDPAAPAVATLVRSAGTDVAAAVAALTPLRWHGEVIGCLVALMPPGVTSLAEPELATCAALADQAAVALAADRLQREVARVTASQERERLARDLHDSVTHALFAVHQRAQLLERALERGDDALLRTAAADLRPLAEQALAAMRRLVDERRDPATDLPQQLREIAATVTDRDGLQVDVATPDAVPSGPEATEHLPHIVREALHNAVKHAGATRAAVTLELRGSELVLSVEDDGRGFDPAAVSVGHGQRTMRERVGLCGGALRVDSAPGRGTRIVAGVPLTV